VNRTSIRRVVTGAAIVLAAMIAFGCSSDDDTSSATTNTSNEELVQVKLFQFQPQSVQVAAGTTVVWENGDDTVHEPTAGTPQAIDPLFDVTIDGVGAKGSFTFDEPGTYQYFCQLHTSMTGEVVVE
jgi:plastocyanin